MIPRSLVPRDVRPATERADAAPPRRLTTLLDERTVVAANLPRGPHIVAECLDGVQRGFGHVRVARCGIVNR